MGAKETTSLWSGTLVLEEIVDLVGVILVGLSPEGKVASINEFGRELLGYGAGELDGRDWVETCVPREERERARLSFDQSLESYENHLLTKDDRRRLVLWRSRLEEDGGALLAGIDITERPVAKQARESERTLSAIVDNLVDAIVTIDERGIIRSASRRAEEMFGYTPGEMVGRSVAMLMPEPYRAEHDRYVRRYLETGQARIVGIGREVEGQRKGGERFPLSLAVSEVRVSDQRLFAGILRDLTPQKRAESDLREAQQRLVALQQQQAELERVAVAGEMAAIVAHEIRTPLNALAINVQMIERLCRRNEPDDRDRALGLMRALKTEVQRVSGLLEDYLKAVRRPGQHERLDLNLIVNQAIEFIQPQATRGQVSIQAELAEDLPPLRGDSAQVRQVILNLLLNALQAMPDGGRVVVQTSCANDVVTIAVEDDGPGIGAESIGTIFKPFVTTKKSGTGLGLAICDRIVRKMGGEIEVTSSEGHGARFDVRLPVAGAG